LSRRNIFIGLAVALVVVGAGVWYFFIRSDAPPPVALDDAVAAVTETTAASDTTSAAETTTAPEMTTTASPTTEGLDGEWVVDQENSFAGYRIGEELASIGTVTAVGRTSDVEATLTFVGSEVTDLSVTVDMTTLESDRSQRDSALRTRGLETADFPTATFELTEPIDLGSAPEEGVAFTATAVGDLTLHGVTNSINLDLEGSLVSGTVVVVGTTDVRLTDYDIEAPTGFSVLTIEEIGTIEVQLALVRS
jgi:polyisoprenoid-binding protein YceI